jgi:RecA/RadA recombinase
MATISKTFDPSKFAKSITKSVKNISTGFNDPDTWISTGNYALNKRISGDFFKGIPLGKITIFAGESGSGKSFLTSGSIVKHAQEQGIFTVLIDTENALDESWLNDVGVDTDPSKILRISASMVDDVAKIISEFVTGYKNEYLDLPKEERPKVLFIIDSLGMLLTPTEVNQFESGDMKGDLGRKAKALKALVLNCTNMIGDLNIGMVFTNHTYANQNMYTDETQVIGGGSGPIFAASIVVVLNKMKLKEDEDGNKTKSVAGIRSGIMVAKTRFAKPFEKIQIKIPYETGLDPYSGLIEMFEDQGLITKDGNKIKYIAQDGTEYKEFRKKFGNDILDVIMLEYDTVMKHIETDSEMNIIENEE